MSIDLTTLSLSIQNITQPQKHILTVLCFISDKNHEVYRAIETLALDCSCSVKTVERTLKKFRDDGILIYTGRMAPNSRNIPVYRINLNHGLTGGDKDLTTDSQSFNHGLSGCLTTDSGGIWKDNIKDNNKDNSNPSPRNPKTKPTNEEFQEYGAGVKGYEWVGEWMASQEQNK